jgi:hypothetical protein
MYLWMKLSIFWNKNYWLRKWKNGSVALANLITNGENGQKIAPFAWNRSQRLQLPWWDLAYFRSKFRQIRSSLKNAMILWYGPYELSKLSSEIPKFSWPVIRKHPLKNDVKSNQDVLFCPKQRSLSLRHISQYCVASHTHKDSFKKLILPETMKTELEEGHFRRGPNHFDMVLDENTAAIQHLYHYYQ